MMNNSTNGLPSPSDDELRELETASRRIRRKIAYFASPWFVEFSGMPRSGKSLCISIIEHFLRRNDFSVLAPLEGARQAPEALKEDLVLYNTWTATYAIRQIIEGHVFRNPQKFDMVLLDRGIFDAMAWIHLLEDDGKIDEDIRKAFTNFLRLDQWRAFVRQVFFFTCSPDTSLSREQDEKLTRKHGLVTQPNVLTRLSSAYEKATDCYKGDFRTVIVNTENSTAQAIAYKVVKDIFDTIDGTR